MRVKSSLLCAKNLQINFHMLYKNSANPHILG